MWPTMWPRHRTTGRDRPPTWSAGEVAAEDLERALRDIVTASE
jgi:hypothetical protein